MYVTQHFYFLGCLPVILVSKGEQLGMMKGQINDKL